MKRLENRRQFSFGYATPCVGNSDNQVLTVSPHRERHTPFHGGEFNGVADEVVENFMHIIGHKVHHNLVFFGLEVEIDVFFVGCVLVVVGNHFQVRHHIAVSPVGVANLRFHLRNVEQLVDESEQALPLPQNHTVEFLRIFIGSQIALFQTLARSENHGEWRAELVGDVCEKRGARMFEALCHFVRTAFVLECHIQGYRQGNQQKQTHNGGNQDDAESTVGGLNFGIFHLQFLVFVFGVENVGLACRFLAENAVGKHGVAFEVLECLHRIGGAQCGSQALFASAFKVAVTYGLADSECAAVVFFGFRIVVLHRHNVGKLSVANGERIVFLAVGEHRECFAQGFLRLVVALEVEKHRRDLALAHGSHNLIAHFHGCVVGLLSIFKCLLVFFQFEIHLRSHAQLNAEARAGFAGIYGTLKLNGSQNVFFSRLRIFHCQINACDGVEVAAHSLAVAEFGVDCQTFLYVIKRIGQVAFSLRRAAEGAVGVACEHVFHSVQQCQRLQACLFRLGVLVLTEEIHAHAHQNGSLRLAFIFLVLKKLLFQIFLLQEFALQFKCHLLVLVAA